MKHILILSLALVMFSFHIQAQQTVKVQRPDNYDANCVLELCIKKKCYSDSVPLKIFSTDNNIELRVNGICTVKKKSDIFVESFEVAEDKKENPRITVSKSSFMNGTQKMMIQQMNKGDSFFIKNIIMHAPDTFRKMSDMKIIIY